MLITGADGWHDGKRGINDGRSERGYVGRSSVMWRRVRKHKNKAAVWQPCLLSLFDSLKPIQSGFFGSRGLFPKKVLESGCGVKPRIYTFSLGRGVGQRPTYISPSCRGAGRGAPPISSPLLTIFQSPRDFVVSTVTFSP